MPEMHLRQPVFVIVSYLLTIYKKQSKNTKI